MRTISRAFSLSAALLVGLQPSLGWAQDDPLVSTALDCSEGGMTCRYWEPVNYDPGKQYPLIVYLHGAGQSGTDGMHVSHFAGALHSLFDQDTGQPLDEYFIIAPQCNCDLETQRWVNWPWENGAYSLASTPESDALQRARAMISGLQGQYSIDADRLYVMGISMGGFGAWDLVARYPDEFAAGAPVAGGGPPDAAPGMLSLATWSSHNADDTAVPVSGDREMFLALAQAGARPTYSEGITGGHDDGGHVRGQNFRPWLLAQRRGIPGTSPPEIRFEPEGGRVGPEATLTLSTALEGAAIRYTLDGSMPTQSTGMEYTGPITLPRSGVVIAVAYDSEQLVYHAAPFDIGDGVPVPGTGGTAGNGSSGAGGDVNVGGGAAGGGPIGAGGGPIGAGGAAGGSGGAGTSGGATQTPSEGTSDDDGGGSCSFHEPRSGRGGVLFLMGLLLAGMSRRRRGA